MGYFNIGIYFIVIILGTLTLAKFVSFLIKIMHKGKIALIRAPKINFIVLYLGLFMLCLFAFELYQMFVQNRYSELYLPLSSLLIGLSQIMTFLDSGILVVQKGVYFSTIPFFVSKSKIKTFKVDNGKILLEREPNSTRVEILFDKADTEKVENALRTLLMQSDI